MDQDQIPFDINGSQDPGLTLEQEIDLLEQEARFTDNVVRHWTDIGIQKRGAAAHRRGQLQRQQQATAQEQMRRQQQDEANRLAAEETARLAAEQDIVAAGESPPSANPSDSASAPPPTSGDETASVPDEPVEAVPAL